MGYEINREQLVARLLKETGVSKERELSKILGMNPTTVNGWKKKGVKINFEKLLETYGDTVDWNYIMVGRRGGTIAVQLRKLEADMENLVKTLQKTE